MSWKTIVLAAAALIPQTASADMWATLARRTAKVGDDLPLRQADEVVETLRGSRGLNDAMNGRFSRLGRATDEVEQAAAQAARRAAVRTALDSATEGLDPAVLRQLDQLDDVARETALVLAEGGQHAAHVVPDIAARSALLRRGGVETLAGVGMFGEDAARAAVRLDAALQAGRVAGARGARAVAVSDFGRLLSRHGEGGWKFWNNYVTPHWGKWLAGGALTAYLLAPEEFMDTAGNLTEGGFEKLTELVGGATAAAIRGISSGAGSAATQVGNAIVDSYFTGWKGIAALAGTIALLVIVLPRPRRAVLAGLSRLATGGAKPAADAEASGPPAAANSPKTE